MMLECKLFRNVTKKRHLAHEHDAECKLNLGTLLKRHLAYMSMMLECKLNLETLLKKATFSTWA